MADGEITKISDQVRQQVDWAKEATLARLLGEAKIQTGLLEAVSGKSAAEIKNLQNADRGAKKLGDAANRAAGALDEDAESIRDSAKNRKKTDRELRASVDDLRYSMNRHSYAFGNMLSGTTNPLRQFPGLLENASHGLAMISRNSGMAAKSILVIGTVLAKVVERFVEGAESYRGMMQSGVMFNGSVNQMIQSVRSSGVSIEAAAGVIDQYGQAIMSMGEQKFFKSIENSANLFARLGMNQQQGMQAFAELDEMRRMSGLAYMQSENERSAMNEKLVTLMQSQATLTGISVKRQQEINRQLAQSEKLRFLQAGMSPEQLKATTEAQAKMASMGMSKELIEATIIEATTGAASKETAVARQAFGPEYERILASVRTGRPEEIGGLEQREAIRVASQSFAQQNRNLMLGQGEIPRLMVSQTLGALEASRAATQAAPGSAEELKQRQERAAAMMRGEQVLDTATQGYFNTVNQTAVALGRVEAMVNRLADPVITGLMASLSALSSHANSLVGAAAGLGNASLYGGLATGAAGMFMLRRMMGRGAGLAMPGMPEMFGPPAPPSLTGGAGAGRTALGALSLAPRVGGLALAGGGLGGALGIGAGAYQAATGQDFGSRMMGIGTGAISGAMMGAMFGPAGAAIGGLLGGGAALAANLLSGQGAQPAATPGAAAPAFVDTNQEVIRLMTMINLKLGEMNSKLGGTLQIKGEVTMM